MKNIEVYMHIVSKFWIKLDIYIEYVYDNTLEQYFSVCNKAILNKIIHFKKHKSLLFGLVAYKNLADISLFVLGQNVAILGHVKLGVIIGQFNFH